MEVLNTCKPNGCRLIAVILMAVLLLCACAPASAPAPVTEEKPSGPPDRVDVVYFYDSQACTCTQWAGDSVQYTMHMHFADKLASGKLALHMVDTRDKKNEPLMRKYKAVPFALFITSVWGKIEHIEPVPEIWTLVGSASKEDFAEVVGAKIEKSLAGELQ